MRFLHRETGNADEVVRHGAAFSSPDGLRAPRICAVLPRCQAPGPHLPARGPHPAVAAMARLRARRAARTPPVCPVPQFPQRTSLCFTAQPRAVLRARRMLHLLDRGDAPMHWHRARWAAGKETPAGMPSTRPCARRPRHTLLGVSLPLRLIQNATEPKQSPVAPSGTGPSAACRSPVPEDVAWAQQPASAAAAGRRGYLLFECQHLIYTS